MIIAVTAFGAEKLNKKKTETFAINVGRARARDPETIKRTQNINKTKQKKCCVMVAI